MERFPISLVKEPTAFTSNDPMEIYNNILVFIVGQVDSRSEMHIFQVNIIKCFINFLSIMIVKYIFVAIIL